MIFSNKTFNRLIALSSIIGIFNIFKPDDSGNNLKENT